LDLSAISVLNASAAGRGSAADGDSDALTGGQCNIRDLNSHHHSDWALCQRRWLSQRYDLLGKHFSPSRPGWACWADLTVSRIGMAWSKLVARVVLDCAFVMFAVFQILQVGFYCLPLVPRDRVSRVLLKFLRTLSLLHRFNHLSDRFQLFGNWLLAWLILISILEEFAGISSS
jgi:hypothetical protein